MRACTFLAAALLVMVGVASIAPGCSTDAVGVKECRRIEDARCEAARHCPKTFDISDVDSCKRFYRDQCLHGLATSDSPGRPTITRCVNVIAKAEKCAAADGEKSLIADCEDVSSNDSSLTRVCQLIEKPESIPECDFLTDEQSGGGGSGGESGEGGESGTSGDANAGSGGR
jgi:hypothetical protein